MTCNDAKKHISVCVGASAHLSEPKKIMGDGGGAALDLYKRDLVFTCHQDVVFLVEHGGQVHTPDENDATHKNSMVEVSLLQMISCLHQVNTTRHA